MVWRKIFLMSISYRENYLNESRSVTITLLDAERPTTLAAPVLLRISNRLRAPISGNPTATVLADEPPHWRGESFNAIVFDVQKKLY